MDKIEKKEKIPLTSEGLKELKEEYLDLLEKKQPAVVERLSKSRNVGDMIEDNEYGQAKQELAFIEGRISELEDVINRAVILSQTSGKKTQVELGCRVTLKIDKKEHVFHLVGEWEANPAVQKISHKSPLGQSLLGKKVGEQVRVEAPVGRIIYTIIRIE